MLRELGARVLADTPLAEGYLEAVAGLGSASGPFAGFEAGWRPTAFLGLGAAVEWTPRETMAGVVARVKF